MKQSLKLILTLGLTICSLFTLSKDKAANIKAYFDKGSEFFQKEKYPEALKLFKKAETLIDVEAPDSFLAVKIYRRIGDCNYFLGHYKKAYSYYIKGLYLIDKLVNIKKEKRYLIHKAHLFTVSGNVLKELDLNKAVANYLKAMKIYSQCNYRLGIGGCYLNIGDCYNKMKDYDKAEDYFKKSIKYFENDDYYSFSIAYSNLSEVYTEKGEFKKAIEILSKSNQMCFKIGRKRGLIFNYILLGKIHKKLENYRKAEECFAKALKLAKELNDTATMQTAFLLLADINAREGHYKDAYQYALNFIKKTQNLYNKELIKLLAKMETLYNTKEMAHQIKKLEAKTEKQKSILSISQFALFVLILCILALLFLLRKIYLITAKTKEQNINLERTLKIIEEVSKTDDLTGLANRRAISEYLKKEIERARRLKQPFCFAICDIDDFKKINDTYSHQVGDIVLMALAKIFKDSVRTIDYVGRWGGEEFTFIFVNTSINNGKKVCEKIRKYIESIDFVVHDKPIKITVTFGVCEFKENLDFDTLFKLTDAALYQGKKIGKNTVVACEYNQNLE